MVWRRCSGASEAYRKKRSCQYIQKNRNQIADTGQIGITEPILCHPEDGNSRANRHTAQPICGPTKRFGGDCRA
jgi:hypothetical protein